MGFLDPYAIDGATITAGQLRQQTFVATNGQTGVQGPDALRVVAVDGSPGVAGILPGSGVVAVQSRRESYTVSNTAMDGDALIDVPAAGSSGATHYVIVSVTDPEYHGQELGAAPRLVPSLAGLSRPFLPLLRIDLEPGEGFDATSEVVDLRRIANPLTEYFAGYTDLTEPFYITSTSFMTAASIDAPIPEWATHALVRLTIGGMGVRGTGQVQGSLAATFSGQAAPGTDHTAWKAEGIGSGATAFFTAVSVTKLPIAPSYRGTVRPVNFRVRRTGTWGDAEAYIASQSALIAEVNFVEEPV